MASRKMTAVESVLLVAVLLAALPTNCFAALAWEKARESPDFPGLCLWGGKIGSYDLQNASLYPEGESWDIGDCIRATCLQLTDGLYIQYASCGAIGVEPPCITVPGNRTLPYPECCPTAWCPEFPPQPTEDPLLSSNQIDKEIGEGRFYRHTINY